MKIFLAALLVAATGAAATLTYSPTEQNNAQNVNLTVVFDDAALANAIKATVTVVPDGSDPDIGDIRGVFFDLVNLPGTVTLTQILAAISGADITTKAINTDTVGNATISPLGPFSIALEIGTTGSGMDDIQSTMFVIDNSLLSSPLTLSNFGAVGVRVQSIGLPGSSREGSSKALDLLGTPGGGGGGDVVPEPATYLLFGASLVGVAVLRRRIAKN